MSGEIVGMFVNGLKTRYFTVPEEAKKIVNAVSSDKFPSGKAWYPSADFSVIKFLYMSLPVLLFASALVYLFFASSLSFTNSLLSFLPSSWILRILSVVVIIYLFLFVLNYGLINTIIGPLMVKLFKKSYFIYVGKEGIVRKTFFKTVFISLQAVGGAEYSYESNIFEMGHRYLVIKTKNSFFKEYLLSLDYNVGLALPDTVAYEKDSLEQIALKINSLVK